MQIVETLKETLRTNIEKNVRKAFTCFEVRKALQIDTSNNDKEKFT